MKKFLVFTFVAVSFAVGLQSFASTIILGGGKKLTEKKEMVLRKEFNQAIFASNVSKLLEIKNNPHFTKDTFFLFLNKKRKQDATFLHHATRCNASVQVMNALLGWGADPNSCNIHGRTPCHLSAFPGFYNAQHTLLLWEPPFGGVAPDFDSIKDNNGLTALDYLLRVEGGNINGLGLSRSAEKRRSKQRFHKQIGLLVE